MTSDRDPGIVDTDVEQEILFQRVAGEVCRMLPQALQPGLTVAEGADVIAAMAVTGVLRQLRVMSARQVAVLLAQEADRHARYVIHEPPRYDAGETGDHGYER